MGFMTLMQFTIRFPIHYNPVNFLLTQLGLNIPGNEQNVNISLMMSRPKAEQKCIFSHSKSEAALNVQVYISAFQATWGLQPAAHVQIHQKSKLYYHSKSLCWSTVTKAQNCQSWSEIPIFRVWMTFWIETTARVLSQYWTLKCNGSEEQ